MEEGVTILEKEIARLRERRDRDLLSEMAKRVLEYRIATLVRAWRSEGNTLMEVA
jgi:hypothetical protein